MKFKYQLLVATLIISCYLTVFIWFIPGIFASKLPYTPPFDGEKCKDVYEPHFEITGESWCHELDCNGATCQPLWESIDWKNKKIYPVSFCYCK